MLEARPPLVVTVTNDDSNVLRLPKVRDVMMANRKPIDQWTVADLGLDAEALADEAASEVLAHECGHTAQALRLSWLYLPAGAAFTLWREGPRWYNAFENGASEQGQFGGLVNGSVCAELMARCGLTG